MKNLRTHYKVLTLPKKNCMKINLILFSSELHDKPNILEARSYLLDNLRAFCDINIINAGNYTSIIEPSDKDYTPNALTVLFIASGGTEEMFLNLFPFIKQPVIILSDGYHNSFAAACEISTWLEDNNIEHAVINVPTEIDKNYFSELNNQLQDIYQNILIQHKLKGEKIGLIGGSSSWLIASQVDKNKIAEKYNITFIDIKNTELSELYFSIKNENKDYSNNPLLLKYRNLLAKDRTEEDLINAIIVYYALKKICATYSLNALTIKCFDLIKLCNVTSCLALAILNDEGIVAGCEGDIPSLITMLLIQKGGGLGFLVNSTSADRRNLTMDFSHCSVPLSMTENFKLTSHFESSLSIGIKGVLPLGKYSLVKLAGQNLDKHIFCTGSVISIPTTPMRCRTQVRFKFNSTEDFDAFMASRVGNHVILFKRRD